MEEAIKHQLLGTTVALAAALALLGSAALASPAGSATRQTAAATPALSAAETAALQYMREEEKLARDVYATLSARWNTPVFRNISRSEQHHMNAIKLLLDRYGVADPAAGAAVGSFKNPTLQSLYTKLVQQGASSFAPAMAVGVQVEKLDIADLQSRLAETDKATFASSSASSREHPRTIYVHSNGTCDGRPPGRGVSSGGDSGCPLSGAAPVSARPGPIGVAVTGSRVT